MKSAAKKLTLSVQTELEFTVTPAPFVPSANLDFIDLAKLGSRRAKLEVGEFTGGCCATKVYARVERGMVTRIELSKCKEARRPPGFLQAALAKGFEAAGMGKSPGFQPIPLAEFIAQARRRFIDWGGNGIDWCVTICIGDFCFFCCRLGDDSFCDWPIVVKG